MVFPFPSSEFSSSLLAGSDRLPGIRTQAAATRPRRRRSLRLGRAIPYGWTLGPILLIAIWSVGSALGLIDPRSLPAPWTVVSTGIDLLKDGSLQQNVAISVQRVAEGFAFGVVAGVVVALVSGLSRIGEYLIDGVVEIKRAIPILALIPLLMLYLGIGEGMKVTIIALSVFVPVYINVHSHLRGIDSRYVELAESLRMGYGGFIRHVVLPGAFPGILLGLRFGVTAAWLALVVVEQINATSGIGYMINLAGSYGQINIVLLGLVVYAVLGFTSDAAVRLVQKKALSWQRTLAS
jgi:sulfonate transport system permease protein